MHKSQILFCLRTALHVLGFTITHLQEHKTTVTTVSGKHYTVLLSVAFVEELEPVWMCCGWRTPPTTHPSGNSTKHERRPPEDGQTIVTETCRCLIMCFTNIFNNLVF